MAAASAGPSTARPGPCARPRPWRARPRRRARPHDPAPDLGALRHRFPAGRRTAQRRLHGLVAESVTAANDGRTATVTVKGAYAEAAAGTPSRSTARAGRVRLGVQGQSENGPAAVRSGRLPAPALRRAALEPPGTVDVLPGEPHRPARGTAKALAPGRETVFRSRRRGIGRTIRRGSAPTISARPK